MGAGSLSKKLMGFENTVRPDCELHRSQLLWIALPRIKRVRFRTVSTAQADILPTNLDDHEI
jgi:hypothetical protein